MRVTYDPDVDAAYVQLADEIGVGGVAFTYPCDVAAVGGMVNLDFDSDGRLVGIEVLGAKAKLPPEVFRHVDPPRG